MLFPEGTDYKCVFVARNSCKRICRNHAARKALPSRSNSQQSRASMRSSAFWRPEPLSVSPGNVLNVTAVCVVGAQGFVHCVSVCGAHVDAIVDVTIAYSGGEIPQTGAYDVLFLETLLFYCLVEMHLLRERLPHSIHFHCRRIALKTVEACARACVCVCNGVIVLVFLAA
jgi:hypothetical protein